MSEHKSIWLLVYACMCTWRYMSLYTIGKHLYMHICEYMHIFYGFIINSFMHFRVYACKLKYDSRCGCTCKCYIFRDICKWIFYTHSPLHIHIYWIVSLVFRFIYWNHVTVMLNFRKLYWILLATLWILLVLCWILKVWWERIQVPWVTSEKILAEKVKDLF